MPIADGTASNIYKVIVTFFNDNNIDYKSNLIGFGADGAHTTMGSNRSVQTLLKNDISNLVVIKCICVTLWHFASYLGKTRPSRYQKGGNATPNVTDRHGSNSLHGCNQVRRKVYFDFVKFVVQI